MVHNSSIRALGCAVAFVSVLLVYPASGLASSKLCHTRGKTIAHSSTARVYRYGKVAVPWVDGAVSKQPAYYGCRYATGKPRRLALEGSDFGSLILRGDFVAFTSFGVDGGFWWVTIGDVNLRTGQRMQQRVSGENDTGLRKLVLTAKGSIAWSTLEKEADPPLGTIYRAAFQQPVTPVDTGGDVDPDSLKLKGATIQWTRGGVLKTEPLVP